MKRYLSFAAILAMSFGMANLAMAHGGGGGGGFHGGGGGMHFGGGGGHFSAPMHGGFEHHGFGPGFRGDHRRAFFWGGGFPYYYGDSGYDELNDYSAAPPVSEADSEVASVQQALTSQGYYRGPIDGSFGPMTHDAITAYERDHRLPMTGAIDDTLLRSLDLE